MSLYKTLADMVTSKSCLIEALLAFPAKRERVAVLKKKKKSSKTT